MMPARLLRRSALAAAALALPLAVPVALAQTRPAAPVVRTYVPPNQLVAFTPDVSLDRFLATLEPIFQRVTGKRVVDPEGRADAIGVPIQGMHFMDAFVYVLARHNLTYKETDRYFVLMSRDELAPAEGAPVVAPVVAPTPAVVAAPLAPAPSAPVSPVAPTVADEARAEAGAAERGNLYLERRLPTSGEIANTGTREVKISAIIFDLNVSKARDLGVDWRYLFGGQAGGGASGGGTGGTGGTTGGTGTTVGSIASGGIDLGNVDFGRLRLPSVLTFAEIGRVLSFLENSGVGRTVASPSITVRSGREARIQVGDDVPVNIRDFQGNTQTQLIPTGTIARVIPTLVSAPLDSTDANSPRIDFVQIDALIERSAPGLFNGSVSISRNQTTTNVILLDGERTVIGGLYSVARTRTRDGVPVLKDLPLLGYLFGRESVLETQREMIVILQAEVVRSVADRFRSPEAPRDLIEQQREHLRQRLQGSSPALAPVLPSTTQR